MLGNGASAQVPAQRFMRTRQFLEGVRAMTLIAAGIGVYGIVFGSLAQQAGLGLANAVGMSLVVYSGAAQFVMLPLMQSGASVFGIALAVAAMSLRHVVMGLALAPSLRHVGLGPRLLLAYAVNDETFAVISARVQRAGATPAFMAGAATITLAAWVASTWVGHSVGQILPAPESLGLDFAFTALFIALLVPQVTSRGGVVAMIVAAIVSVSLVSVAGLGVAVAAGGVAGALIGGVFER
jgi:4-azaleucine resistance transporter AzlC